MFEAEVILLEFKKEKKKKRKNRIPIFSFYPLFIFFTYF